MRTDYLQPFQSLFKPEELALIGQWKEESFLVTLNKRYVCNGPPNGGLQICGLLKDIAGGIQRPNELQIAASLANIQTRSRAK